MRTLKSVVVGAVAAFALAGGWAWGGIEGSKHDFSNREWSGGNKCGACHSPHRDKQPTAAPLWNPTADLSRTFGTPISQAKTEAPGRGTLICLRCHNGTIARDALGGVKRTRFAGQQHPGVFGAGHGATDHPVGVDYPKFDKRFRPRTSVVARGTVILPNGKVECSSCHDPHNTSGARHMLVTSNARSALCLTCHKK